MLSAKGGNDTVGKKCYQEKGGNDTVVLHDTPQRCIEEERRGSNDCVRIVSLSVTNWRVRYRRRGTGRPSWIDILIDILHSRLLGVDGIDGNLSK